MSSADPTAPSNHGQRLFIAVDIDSAVKAKLLQCQGCQSVLDDAALRWSRADQLHLTLAYLGPQPCGCLDSLVEQLSLRLKNHRSFTLQIDHISSFPRRRPKVLVAQCINSSALESLYRSVHTAVRDAGLVIPPPPHHFHPHITLARLKCGSTLDLNLPLHLSMSVSVVTLFHSDLTPERAIHTAVQRLKLVDQ
ncbi:MAG: RNA 2',3'-cyclic phosphodiesterase [Desulfuromonas sp.]|nr:RNA 2',3'-cyclic phosphodiesterase [Desulfuromonas sp.]